MSKPAALLVMGSDSDLPVMEEAAAYRGVAAISWKGVHYRRDIGSKALRGEE